MTRINIIPVKELKETSLIWQAHQMLERWRAWSEKRDALHEEFCALVNDSDDLQDRLLIYRTGSWMKNSGE